MRWHSATAMLTALLWLGGFAMAQETAPLRLVQSIPLPNVDGRIDHMCLDADGRRLFIAALENNTVEVVDVQTGVHTGTIGGIREPQGVAYVAESRRLAAASGRDDSCQLYDDALAAVGKITGLPDADNVRYDPRARLLYVGYGDGAIAVIEPKQPRKIADIRLDGHPESFQLEGRGTRIFVNVPSARQVAVIDREKRAVVTTWKVNQARANFPMALDEAHHRLFVACREPTRLLVFDTETGKVLVNLDCCGDADDVFYDAGRRRIYVSGGAGSISIFLQTDAEHYTLAATIPTASGARTALLSPDANRLYVAVPHRGSQGAQIRVYEAHDR